MTQPLDAQKTSAKKTVRSKKKNRAYIWNESPYDSARCEKALWKAVITQALMDAQSRSSKAEDQYHKHEARRWLTSNGKDFRMVCLLAGEDPDYIRGCVKKVLASPRPWRAEAGFGQRYEQRKAYRQRRRQHRPAATAVIQLPLGRHCV